MYVYTSSRAASTVVIMKVVLMLKVFKHSEQLYKATTLKNFLLVSLIIAYLRPIYSSGFWTLSDHVSLL